MIDFMQTASSDFLTDDLPDNWAEMEESELMDFISEHAWETFENKCPEEIFDLIKCSACRWQSLFEANQPRQSCD